MSYYAYEYDQLKAMLMSGDAGSVKDMAARWKKMKTDLETRRDALYDLLDKVDGAWEGEASEAFKDPMYNLAITAGLGSNQANSNWNALEDAADALTKAQTDVPDATSMRASGNTEGLTLLQGNKMAYQQEYEAYQQDKQVIITRLNQVDTAYSGSADQIKDPPTYDGPPPKPVEGDDKRIADGSGGGGAGGGDYAATAYSGTGGGGGYAGTGGGGTGGGGGSGGSAGYGGSPALTGTSSYSGGDTNLSSGGVIGGPALPGGTGLPGGGASGLPGGAPGGVGGVGGGVIGGGLPGGRGGVPGGGLPGRGGGAAPGGGLPGRGAAGGGALPGRGAAGGGALGGPGGAAGGRGGGVSGRLGPGGVLGGGPGSASGGPGASGGAAGGRGGGMAGRGGAMMGGAGGQGQDRRRSTWLQETEDVWHGDQEAAPPILGDPQDDQHTNR